MTRFLLPAYRLLFLMQVSINILSAVAGEAFERDFLGAAEILVRREGHSRARHLFTVNGRTIARLRWHGQRRAVAIDEQVPFLQAAPLRPEQEEDYGQPHQSGESASLYEHCVRAIEHGLR